MKHPNDTKNKFIELRAQGVTLDAISQQIGVPKATLGRWNIECLQEIQRLRAIQWELLEDQMGHRFEDCLTRIAQRIRRLEDQLDSRTPERFTRIELMRVIRQSRLEYLKLRSILMAPLQPTRSRTPCLGDLDPQQRDTTVQNSKSRDTTSLQQNDLQQPEPAVSHSPYPEETPHGVPALAGPMPDETNKLNQPELPPAESNSPSHLPTFPPAHLPELEPGDEFTGSTPFNSEECIQSILQKCLDTDRLHHKSRSPSPNSSS